MLHRHWTRVVPRIAVAVGFCCLGLFGGQALAAHHNTSSDTLVIGWNADGGPPPNTLDPTSTISNGNDWVYVNIFSELLHVANNGTGLQPGLATTWKITNHGKTYTFHLRKNVEFSNGQKLKASDVVFSINRGIASPNWGSLYPKFKSITAPNNSTVILKLNSPWAPLLSDLAFYDVGVYPESYFKQVGASGFANHPISAGPYELKSWSTVNNEVVLQKNPHYWDSSAYPMKYVDLLYTANDNTRLEALQAGTIDVDEGLPTSLVPVAKGSSGIKVEYNRSTDIIVVTLNDKLAQFKDL
jgi:peptide/nickel transport system substrate-binding protein